MSKLAQLSAIVLGSCAFGQCDPAWSDAPGQIGLADGYAEAAVAWDDGGGEDLYVGGSFTKIGGLNGLRGVGRWDPQTGEYSRMGSGISFGSSNGFVTSIQPFDAGGGRLLVVGGFFASAGGQAGTQSLAAWDGSAWRSLGAGFVAPEAVWSLEVGDLGDGGLLYLAGGFQQIAGMACSGVASWDGVAFGVLGDGLGMTGFSPFVNETAIWDDGSGVALYAVGRFESIDGVDAALAARFRPASGWERIGPGLVAVDAITTLDAAAVFDDGRGEALYVAGSPFRASGQGFNSSVLRWDGVAWESVGQNVGGRVTDLRVWDDGTGPALYLSGTATPGINYLARLEDGSWEIYLGGVAGPAIPPSNFPSVFGLGEFRGDLVVCGNYTTMGDGGTSNGVALITTCAGDCVADFNGDGMVDTRDMIAFLNAWSAGEDSADIDGNGIVDTRDVITFLNLWTSGC